MAVARRSGRARAACRAAVAAGALLIASAVVAREAAPEAADPALEARMVRITSELRCLVCQNQTIADSNAALAVDLRREARSLLKQGKSDREVIDYMTDRYGDFVLYRPPMRATTVLPWFGPALMLVGGAVVLVVVLRRRSRLSDAAFEPDENSDDVVDDAARSAALHEAASAARKL